MKKTPVPTKLCLRCSRALPLADFYPNRGWEKQKYRDVWCRECVIQYCQNRDAVKQYCYDNNRAWKDSYWDSALKKAQYVLANDAEYLNPKTSGKRKKEIENRTAARQFFSLMNLEAFYGYVENVGEDGKFVPDVEEKADEDDAQKLKYNRKWGGFFSQEQIETLEEIYSQYEEDFVLDNVNIRDYARKVAKASLNADIAEDKARRGEISQTEYKEAQKIFDDLSKSSNFAACRRKPGESSGMGSLGEIIMRLEISGALNANGFTFPEDDVDKIIADFRRTLHSVGLDGQL